MKGLKKAWDLTRTTFKEFGRRDAFRSSAVIAYFAIFSLPGLLVIVINTAGTFYDHDRLQELISGQVTDLIGAQAATDINGILDKVQENDNATWTNILSWATLIFGATGMFYHIQKSLNQMWGVEAKPEQKLLKVLRDRLFSFGMILVIAVLMIISLVMSTVLTATSQWLSDILFKDIVILFQLLDLLIALAVLTVLFAATFKFLPDAEIPWRSVWIGALVTTVLFLLAKYALSLYFGKADPGAVYGAASSLVLVMLWVTYTAMIILFGAEFTLLYARRHGYRVTPTDAAKKKESDKKI